LDSTSRWIGFFKTGHAAGVAEALSYKLKKVSGKLVLKNIREVLKNDGVNLSRGGEEQDNRMAM